MTPRPPAASDTGKRSPEQPTRGADRNQWALTDDASQPTEDVLLPSLEAGMTLLDIDGGRGVPFVHSLVLDHLLLSDGPAFWIDARGYATTTTLARLAPSQRLLARIHVARGFTAYQHYGALCDLPTAVNQYVTHAATSDSVEAQRDRALTRPDRDPDTSPQTPALIVAPALDAQYRADDTLSGKHAETLQARALARLSQYAHGYDIPVLITRTQDDEFTTALESATAHHLRCEQTSLGPRFVCEEFETLVYPVGDGAYYQTTFAYWRQLLSTRADQVGLEPVAPSHPTENTAGVGTGVTADGETTTLTANLLLDAWTTAGAGGR